MSSLAGLFWILRNPQAVDPFGQWNGWSLYWLAWFVLGFGLPEGVALGTGHPQNTLSDQIWRLEGNFGPPWTWTTVHWVVATFWIVGTTWLAGHMIDHIWR